MDLIIIMVFTLLYTSLAVLTRYLLKDVGEEKIYKDIWTVLWPLLYIIVLVFFVYYEIRNWIRRRKG